MVELSGQSEALWHAVVPKTALDERMPPGKVHQAPVNLQKNGYLSTITAQFLKTHRMVTFSGLLHTRWSLV
jgi:hypothetical protein